MYYETYGDEKGYPIVLIHPIGGNIKIWEHEILFIRKKSFRIIAYELRGHNRSNMGERKSFTIEDLAIDLEKLLRNLNIRKCTLIGHSIGGAIASLYVQKNSHSVDAIIFINASSTRIPNKDLEKHFTTRRIAIVEGMYVLAQWIRHENMVTERAFHDKKKWDLFEEIFTKTSVEGFVAANALYTMPGDVTAALKNTECKLFGIVGSEDDVFEKLMNEMKK